MMCYLCLLLKLLMFNSVCCLLYDRLIDKLSKIEFGLLITIPAILITLLHYIF